MRLSKPRLILRAVLLLVLAGFMAWRARETGQLAAGPGLEAGGGPMLARIALIEWILAGLALLTAGAAVFALRPRQRARPLQLGDSAPEGTGGGASAEGAAQPPGPPGRDA